MLLPLDKSRNIITILERGFLIFQKKPSIALLLSFLGVVCLALSIYIKINFTLSTPLNWLLPIISLVLSQVFLGALIFFLYTANKNLPCSLKRALFFGFEKLPSLVITLFLYSLIVFIGTVAFVIPGIILSITCVFGLFLLYTDNYDPILALTSSFQFSKNQIFTVAITLLTLGLFIFLSNLLGLTLGYLFFIIFTLKISQVFLINLTLLTLINTLLVPLSYGVMLSLLHDLKIKHDQDAISTIDFK